MKKWFRGVDPKRRKELVTRKILDLIPQSGETSWSALLEKAIALGIGRATLSRHLKALIKSNIIERRVDTSTYPPRVYYKRRSFEEPRFYMPYEVAAGLFPQPTRESSIREVEQWILAQTRLFVAKIILELAPPPFLFKGASNEEIENHLRELFYSRSKNLLNQMVQLQCIFSSLTLFDIQKAQRTNEIMILEYYKMFEQALELYNLTLEKVATKSKIA
jgi:DNA-binding transcriptional ArsR family regulator